MSAAQPSGDIEMLRIRDWRQALRSPPTYRIVNRTLRNQKQFLLVLGAVVLLFLYILSKYTSQFHINNTLMLKDKSKVYNSTYPLSVPIITEDMSTFRIGLIADLDTNSKSSKEKHTWYSYFKKGFLSYSPLKRSVTVTWDTNVPTTLTTNFAMKDRGMELSELIVFDGKLLSFDDRTGMVFLIENEKAFPWLLLMDGDGKSSTKGFKSEWASVHNEHLVVGSMGKEWTDAGGKFQTNHPQYVKVINMHGQVKHVSWVEEFKRIREVLDIHWPGYMIHESGVWSDHHQRWFFLPRRCSKERYNETMDERMGCSVLISADADVGDIKAVQLLNKSSTRGFSSFKFVPTTDDSVIVALRTEEINGRTATYITSFDINGATIMDDLFVSNLKYEGIEFI